MCTLIFYFKCQYVQDTPMIRFFLGKLHLKGFTLAWMDVSCMNTVHVDILNVDYNVLFFFFFWFRKRRATWRTRRAMLLNLPRNHAKRFNVFTKFENYIQT